MPSLAQLSLNNAGVGFNFNIGQRVPNGAFEAFFPESASNITRTYNGSLSRVFSEYRVGFDVEKRKAMYLEATLLQGTDYYSSYDYEYGNSNDSSYSRNTSIDVSSSLVGLRTMLRLSTPQERRAFVSGSFGVECLGAYDVGAEFNESYSSSNWRTSVNINESTKKTSDQINSYASINLVQEVGLSVKLGKEDKNYPLDRIYVQTHFQALSNFTILGEEVNRYRTFGISLSLNYQF